MATCETCRFWAKLNDQDARFYGFPAGKYGCCSAILGRDMRKPGVTPAVMTTEGDDPDLMTLPTFGCVLHENGE